MNSRPGRRHVPSAECLRVLDRNAVPAAAYRTVREAMADPQLEHRGAFGEVRDAAGSFKALNPPFRMSAPRPRWPPVRPRSASTPVRCSARQSCRRRPLAPGQQCRASAAKALVRRGAFLPPVGASAPDAAGPVAGRGLSQRVRATFQPPACRRCGLAAAEPMLRSPTERRCRTVPPGLSTRQYRYNS